MADEGISKTRAKEILVGVPTKNISRGMILCAGLGTRLLPVTDKLPKPLVPVVNLPNVLHTLYLFKAAGISEVILNLHHLSDAIERFLGDGSRWGMKLQYSKESILQGTGGGVKQAESFFRKERFVLANCDFVTNLRLLPAIRFHEERKALATMMLVENPLRQHHYSKVGVNENSEIVLFPKLSLKEPTRVGIFTGVHILENETLQYLKREPSGINELLYPRLMREKPQRALGYFIENQYWRDTGEFNTIFGASMDLLSGLEKDDSLRACLSEMGGYQELKPGVWAPEGTQLPTGVNFQGPVILGAHCQLEEGVAIGPCVVLASGSHLKAGAAVSRTVLWNRSVMQENQRYSGLLIFDDQILFDEKKRP